MPADFSRSAMISAPRLASAGFSRGWVANLSTRSQAKSIFIAL
jgi:hypothetical protein